jgi:acetylglutamate kinase
MNKIASVCGPLVVKYGGSALQKDDADPILDEVARIHLAGRAVVLVHGGGPEIDRALARRRIVTKRIDGLRVTGSVTLEVTEAVLCATINKRIVRALLHAGARAVGISGQDGRTLVADRTMLGDRHPDGGDLGYVGTVVETHPELLRALLNNGFMPVVSPLAVSRDASHALNVNADSAAAAIAAGIEARALVMLTDVPRVLRDPRDPSSAFHRLSLGDALAFAGNPACRDGMRPKLQAAVAYASAGFGPALVCSAKTGIAAALGGDATIVSPNRYAKMT